MNRVARVILVVLCSTLMVNSVTGQPVASTSPVVTLKTKAGVISIELFPDKAPQSVENFLKHIEEGYYDGVVFHRVIKDFLVQAGRLTKAGHEKPQGLPIENEANNGLSNVRGTVAVARGEEVHSGAAEFFFNVRDNTNLDFRGPHRDRWGYAVFGRVISGMEVVDAIASAPTSRRQHVPIKPVVILKASHNLPSPRPSFAQLPRTKGETTLEKQAVVHLDGLMATSKPNLQRNWPEAYNYCLNLDLAGYSDWRLPTIQEMKSMDTRGNRCAPRGIDYPLVTFGCVEYWSADEDGIVAYAYGFDDKEILRQDKGYAMLILCIRRI